MGIVDLAVAVGDGLGGQRLSLEIQRGVAGKTACEVRHQTRLRSSKDKMKLFIRTIGIIRAKVKIGGEHRSLLPRPRGPRRSMKGIAPKGKEAFRLTSSNRSTSRPARGKS
ncbi:hypothetical protein [Sinorhizobium mexicanum]|uniref:Uncharacterized protein n=1 Tax=Sinorhizobium mexicanum TaxID=375549 RepID=A0A859QQV3_9HYPH|nr:hypothetical protein [Sinorhizobium mexicanum]MBP1884846.1 hypothetical protein [Sinorhizobium mexicanum]QLL64497.1 hypothetical protein FKV68_24120 [Sinorhizobium mexicanum]